VKLRLTAALLLVSGAAYAGNEFDRVVKAIETHYGVERVHIPLLGVANFFVKVIRPAGVSGFKLAVFEHFHAQYHEFQELDAFMDGLASDELRPMIRTHRPGEATYILTGDIGKTTKMLVVTFDHDEATVVQLDANMETLLRTLNSPGDARSLLLGTRERNDRNDRDDK
jgi:hypothetical protein